LVRAVHIIAAHDNGWKLEALEIRVNKHLGSRFARSVGVGRSKNARFMQVIITFLDLAVDLVGRDVNEALDASLFGTLQKDVRTVHVGVREAVGVAEAQVDVRLGSEMKHRVNFMALHAVQDLGRVGEVAVVEGKVASVIEGPRVIQGGAVVELVKGDYVVGMRVGEGEVADDPRCTA